MSISVLVVPWSVCLASRVVVCLSDVRLGMLLAAAVAVAIAAGLWGHGITPSVMGRGAEGEGSKCMFVPKGIVRGASNVGVPNVPMGGTYGLALSMLPCLSLVAPPYSGAYRMGMFGDGARSSSSRISIDRSIS